MIVWGGILTVSIGALFLAGILPGLLIGIAQMATVHAYAKARGYPTYPRSSFRQLLCALWVSIPALMTPFMQDRRRLLTRLTAGLTVAQGMPIVDSQRIAVMGFCFGGLCALDFARANSDVRGVASFHGLLKPSGFTEPKIRAKVLILHGYDDPLAPPEDVLAIASELTAAGADWQLHAYGHTVHAFTNPKANDRAGGKQYDEAADRRSWHALEEFLAEVLK